VSLRESCIRENRTCSLSGGRRPARKRASSDPTLIKTSTMITSSNSLSRGSGMPHQVDGAFVRAMSGTELSRVRTEFRLRLPEPINKSPLESRGPTLLCNQVPFPLLGNPSHSSKSRRIPKFRTEQASGNHESLFVPCSHRSREPSFPRQSTVGRGLISECLRPDGNIPCKFPC